MVCNVLFKNEDQAICPAECVNAVNRDERAFVKHGRMQDLLRGAQLFVVWASCVPGKRAKEVLGHAPSQKKKKNLNDAIWCVLEYIFIISLLRNNSKDVHFLYKIIYIIFISYI